MVERILIWLDTRTDYRRLLLPIRRRVLPGGPRWEYSTASCLLWLLVVEALTGFLLMATYSPSVTSAWASVHFIEESQAGSFIRGLHHYTSHALIVMFVIHIGRVLWRAGFRPPHELVWVTGLLLFPVTILWAITGNPLSATVRGMAQIEVEGNILGSTPLVGPWIQRMLIGGDEVGHLTLTHLYFLHVALLPLGVGLLLAVHIAQVYRYGLATPHSLDSRELARSVPYWPYQTLRNMIVLAGVLGALSLMALVWKAPLDAPADPQLPHTPRPEWYFLCLFELRRYFTGNLEFVATLVIPLLGLGMLLAMPLVEGRCSARFSSGLRAGILFVGLGGWAGLTLTSLARDWQDAEFRQSRAQTEAFGRRAGELANHNEVPPEGAIALLRGDPQTQGPLIFAQHCAACHSHLDAAGNGIAAHKPSAANLYGFAGRRWIAGLLDPQQFGSPNYFGNTRAAGGDMAGAIAEAFDKARTTESTAELRSQLEKAAWALSAEAALPDQLEADRRDQTTIAAGAELIGGALNCTECHRFRDKGELGSAPDLTGYGSRDWLVGIISNPQHERFYPDDRNDRMPAFAESADQPQTNLLGPREVQLLADWLREPVAEPQGIQPAQ